MSGTIARVSLLVISLLLPAEGIAAQDASTDPALARLVEQWASARNAHDAEAMRTIFDLHVDHINMSSGEVLATNQDGLVRWFDDGFKRDGRSTTARVGPTRVRVLSPDVGLVDFVFTLHGAGGQAVSTGHAAFVCTRGVSGWKVSALRFASTPAK